MVTKLSLISFSVSHFQPSPEQFSFHKFLNLQDQHLSVIVIHSGSLRECIHCILKTLGLGFLQKFSIGRKEDEIVQKKGNVCNRGQGKEGILVGIHYSKNHTACHKGWILTYTIDANISITTFKYVVSKY